MEKKYKFDDRRKELKHTIVEKAPLLGKEEYGFVEKKTEIISNAEGTTRVLMFLEQQEKNLNSEIQKTKDRLEQQEKELSLLKEDIKKIKDAVGSRINFKKIKEKIQKKEKEDKK